MQHCIENTPWWLVLPLVQVEVLGSKQAANLTLNVRPFAQALEGIIEDCDERVIQRLKELPVEAKST